MEGINIIKDLWIVAVFLLVLDLAFASLFAFVLLKNRPRVFRSLLIAGGKGYLTGFTVLFLLYLITGPANNPDKPPLFSIPDFMAYVVPLGGITFIVTRSLRIRRIAKRERSVAASLAAAKIKA